MPAFGINSLCSQQIAIVETRFLRTHIEKDEASSSEGHVSNKEVFWLWIGVIVFDYQAVGCGNFKYKAVTKQQNSSGEVKFLRA